MKLIKLYIIIELIISFPLTTQTSQIKNYDSNNDLKIEIIREPYSVGFWKRYKNNHKEMAIKAHSKNWKK